MPIITVGKSGNYETIQAAIDAAASGDEIVISAGNYSNEAILKLGGKDLTLRAEDGADEPVIVGSIFQSGGDLTIQDLTVRATAADSQYGDSGKTTGIGFAGGADDTLTVVNTDISVAYVDGTGPQGVGIDISAATGAITIMDSTIGPFTAYPNGGAASYGIYLNGSDADARVVSITGNIITTGTDKSAAIALEGVGPAGLTIEGNTFGAPGTSPGAIRIFDFSDRLTGTVDYSGISGNTFAPSGQANPRLISNETSYPGFDKDGVAIRAGSFTFGSTAFDAIAIGSDLTPLDLLGSNGRDFFIAGLAGGTLSTAGGDDVLLAGSGVDTLTGGGGGDFFTGTIKNFDGDTISDFSAGDRIGSTNGSIDAFAVTGNTLTISSGGQDAAITLTSVPTNGAFQIADGTLIFVPNPPPVGGGGGNPMPPATMTPTAGPDNLVGTTGADTLSGGLGDDSLAGGQGNDQLNGNQGNDTVLGGEGNDQAQGGQGDDDVRGEAGNDSVYGDLGNDTVSGGQGDDIVFGGQGFTARGVVDGNDVINGNQGNDLVNGNAGDDIVSGGQGNDSVYGGQGNDTVFGDLGDDLISGDKGNDVLTGGAGADTFVFASGSGADIITDFSFADGDRLDLQGRAYSLTTADDESAALLFADGDVIILQNVTQDQFSTDFFA